MGVPPANPSTNIFNSRRPVLLSADSRRISYKSRSGRVLTLEMRSSRAGLPTLASLKAAAQQQQQQQQQLQQLQLSQDASTSVQSQALQTQQQKQLAAAADAKTGPAAQAAALVAQANNTDESAAGMWPELFDTLSFWCMEAVEIACFGPYEEPEQLYDALDAYAESVAATPAVEHPPALEAAAS